MFSYDGKKFTYKKFTIVLFTSGAILSKKDSNKNEYFLYVYRKENTFQLRNHQNELIKFKNYHSYLLDDHNRIWMINNIANLPTKSVKTSSFCLKKFSLLMFYILLGIFICQATIATFRHFFSYTL